MTTTDDDIDFDFSSGGLAAQEQAKAEREARKAARGTRTYLTSILNEDGATCLVRFVTDEPPGGPNGANIYVNQHYVPTKGAPKGKPKESDWPDRAGAVCRYTKVGPKNNQRSAYNDCYICDIMRDNKGKKYSNGQRGWAIAVIRKEVVGTQEMVDAGRIHESQIGQRLILDQMDLVDEMDAKGNTTGNKVWKKRYVIVNQRIDNFFSTLITSGVYNKTILDRDYRITRKGAKGQRGTQFVVNALDPYEVTVLRDGEPVVIRYDLREPEIAALYADSGVDRQSLLKMVSRKLSDSFYNRFFDPRVEVSWNDGRDDDEADSGPATPPPPTPQQQAGQSISQEPTEGVTADALAAMRDRVMKRQAPPAATTPTPPPAPAATAPAAAAPQAAPPAPAAAAPAPAPLLVQG